MKRNNYYRIFGKNMDRPVCFYAIAKTATDAKTNFLSENIGMEIISIKKISKLQYYSNK